MNKKYIPTWYCKKAIDIDVQKLASKNFKLVFCDIDNTLVSPFVATPTKQVCDFVSQFAKYGIKFVLISNNNQERVSIFAKELGVEYIYKAKKPSPKKLLAYLNEHQYQLSEVIAIGDQIMTDVQCANRAKISVILVDKLEKKEQFITFFPRRIDIIVRKRLQRKHLLRKL